VILLSAAIAIFFLVPACILLIECAAAQIPLRKREDLDAAERPRVDILVPAHNEQDGLPEMLRQLKTQLRPGDRVLVIADNCTDATAQVARRLGVDVAERSDPDRRGKSYALEFGVNQLEDGHAPVVVVIDADCYFDRGALDRIVQWTAALGRPVQAAYRMELPPQPAAFDLVSYLAVGVKNLVRPAGLSRMGLPCLLTGSGMAFPWEVLRALPLASGHIAEDYNMSVDLFLDDRGAIYCNEAQVRTLLPARFATARRQRKRWEHGHMQIALQRTPLLALKGIFRAKPSMLAMALDVAIPPLSLLISAWLFTIGATVVLGLVGLNWMPAAVAATAGAVLILAMLLAWRSLGTKNVPLRIWLVVPWYVLRKLPIYVAYLFRRERQWVRTPRDNTPAVTEAEPVEHAVASEEVARP
jgi:cellulose synthase/poly-beta-1,6-N-acetylglucosamine synthase-like glycosyltransferase